MDNVCLKLFNLDEKIIEKEDTHATVCCLSVVSNFLHSPL